MRTSHTATCLKRGLCKSVVRDLPLFCMFWAKHDVAAPMSKRVEKTSEEAIGHNSVMCKVLRCGLMNAKASIVENGKLLPKQSGFRNDAKAH
eukprot:614712-Amphidinium_carterae.1